jgi:hypothetical protein
VAEPSAKRLAAVAGLVAAVVGGAVSSAVALSVKNGSGSTEPSSTSRSTTTAVVVRTDLTTTMQVGGSIGFRGAYTIPAPPESSNEQATYTSLPNIGEIVKQGQPLYSLNDQPVVLLYGSLPAYRAFTVGMSTGSDVGELTRDLVALGYGHGLARGSRYTSATAIAVERWQRALGRPATGTLALGDVIFEPGPIRITSINPSLGESVAEGGGSILSATSTRPVVTLDLAVAEEYLVKPGNAVSIVLPDGTSTVGGHVTTIGDVATCPGGGGTGLGGSAESPCESSGSGNSSSATVPVTISLDRAPPEARLDQAPVNVTLTSQRADHVLAVPISALLALAGGGYGVDVVAGRTEHIVAVTTGLYSNTLVQVGGSGIAAGMRIEVPSS